MLAMNFDEIEGIKTRLSLKGYNSFLENTDNRNKEASDLERKYPKIEFDFQDNINKKKLILYSIKKAIYENRQRQEIVLAATLRAKKLIELVPDIEHIPDIAQYIDDNQKAIDDLIDIQEKQEKELKPFVKNAKAIRANELEKSRETIKALAEKQRKQKTENRTTRLC